MNKQVSKERYGMERGVGREGRSGPIWKESMQECSVNGITRLAIDPRISRTRTLPRHGGGVSKREQCAHCAPDGPNVYFIDAGGEGLARGATLRASNKQSRTEGRSSKFPNFASLYETHV